MPPRRSSPKRIGTCNTTYTDEAMITTDRRSRLLDTLASAPLRGLALLMVEAVLLLLQAALSPIPEPAASNRLVPVLVDQTGPRRPPSPDQ